MIFILWVFLVYRDPVHSRRQRNVQCVNAIAIHSSVTSCSIVTVSVTEKRTCKRRTADEIRSSYMKASNHKLKNFVEILRNKTDWQN